MTSTSEPAPPALPPLPPLPEGVSPHPWSQSFTWKLGSRTPAALTQEQVDRFDRDGWLIVDDVVAPELAVRLRDELDAIEAETEAALRTLDGERHMIAEADAIVFSPHVATRSAAADELVRSPRLAMIAGDLLGPDIRLYWDQLVYKKPAKPRRFPWHQDNGYTFVNPQQYITFWIALTDATIDSGCPWVVPGLHRHGTLAHRWIDPLGWECLTGSDQAVAAEVPAGSAVMFSSLTPHLTGPNVTGEVRRTYIVQYAPDGSTVSFGDPAKGPAEHLIEADDAQRQFPVLAGGQPV